MKVRSLAPGAVSEFREGWPALLAALIGITFGISSVLFYSVGLFIRPMQAEFGWTRTEISLVSLAATLTLALALPFVGAMIDRVGARLAGSLSLAGLGLGFLALSRIGPSLPVYVGLSVAIALAGAASTPVSFTRIVVARFERHRGLALGLALAGTGLTGLVLPRVLGPYIAAAGWRGGYVVLGVSVLVVAPVVWLLTGGVAGGPAVRARASGGPALRDIVRTPRFVLLLLSLFAAALAVGGFVVHLVPMLSDRGLSAASAGSVAGRIGVAVIVGRVLTGWTADRWPAEFVGATLFGLASVGMAVLAGAGLPAAGVAAIGVGLALGAEVDLAGLLAARYFGVAAYSAVYGILYAGFLVGMALSPALAAAAFDQAGNYDAALIGGAALLALATAGMLALYSVTRRS